MFKNKYMKNLERFLKNNIVMVIAFVLALFTCIFVPVDYKYVEYFDYKTLVCLFCVLAVVCCLRNIDFFNMLAIKIVTCFKSMKTCVLGVVYLTFIGSMFIANDMALITFLPLGYHILKVTNSEKYMAFTFIMQNIAANLGGMLTPFGNPQNLYLYSKYNIGNEEFISIMFLPFVVSMTLITICCLFFIKNEKIIIEYERKSIDKRRMIIYLILFAVSIMIVFREIPYKIGALIVIIAVFCFDKKALKMVDYPLLLTFVFFFVFSGNMARINIVHLFIENLLNKNTLIYSILSCQFISNVPTAILLSQFTTNYKELLLGVNVGGIGTLISSLASLITLREYLKHNKKKVKYYIAMFFIFNFTFLFILIAMIYLFKIV